MPDESDAAEETKQRVQGYLQGLKPILLHGAPKASARWSGTLTNLKAENRLGRGSFSEVWVSPVLPSQRPWPVRMSSITFVLRAK